MHTASRAIWLISKLTGVSLVLCLSCNLIPAFASSNPKDEQRLEALEQKFFSETFKSETDDARLARVEDMLFNHSSNGPAPARLDALEAALVDIKSTTKPKAASADSVFASRKAKFIDQDQDDDDGFAPQGLAQKRGSFASNSKAAAVDDGFGDDDSPDMSFYSRKPNSPQFASTGKAFRGNVGGDDLKSQLSAMEVQIFGKPNDKQPLINRIKKLEQNILGSGANSSEKSLPERVAALQSAIQSGGATKDSKDKANKPSIQTSSKTPLDNEADNATNADDDKSRGKSTRSASKNSDDNISDDEAMAQYLQTLRKKSGRAASKTASNSSASGTKNKSGWMDEPDSPMQGGDPDYTSDDDNPPIVIGGNASMNSMINQGYVQNFGSGMGFNSNTNLNQSQVNKPGLFSKIGQAVGGAMNGGNNYNSGYGGMGGYGGYGGYPNIMPYGYGGMSPYSGYGGLGGYSGYGGYAPPMMGPSLGGIGSYGNVSPYGVGGPSSGNPYGINPYGNRGGYGNIGGFGGGGAIVPGVPIRR